PIANNIEIIFESLTKIRSAGDGNVSSLPQFVTVTVSCDASVARSPSLPHPAKATVAATSPATSAIGLPDKALLCDFMWEPFTMHSTRAFPAPTPNAHARWPDR